MSDFNSIGAREVVFTGHSFADGRLVIDGEPYRKMVLSVSWTIHVDEPLAVVTVKTDTGILRIEAEDVIIRHGAAYGNYAMAD